MGPKQCTTGNSEEFACISFFKIKYLFVHYKSFQSIGTVIKSDDFPRIGTGIISLYF